MLTARGSIPATRGAKARWFGAAGARIAQFFAIAFSRQTKQALSGIGIRMWTMSASMLDKVSVWSIIRMSKQLLFRWRLALMLLACAGAILSLYFWFRPKSLVSHARTIARAKFEGDARTLFDYMMPDERRILGLNLESFRRVCDELIKPRMAAFTKIEREEITSEVDQAICELHLVSPNGVQFDLAGSAFPSDDDRGAYDQPGMFQAMLTQAWLAEYRAEHKRSDLTKLERWKVCLAALDKDEPLLVELGIKGFLSYRVEGMGFSDLRLIPWEEYRQRLVRTIAKLSTEQKTPVNQGGSNFRPSIG